MHKQLVLRWTAFVLCLFVATHAVRLTAATNFEPQLTIARTNQGLVVLSWFGEIGVIYQLESSPDLTTWSELGSPITGLGNEIIFTHSASGQSAGFFRLKFVLPNDTITAVFDPQTGVLTVTGDDLANVIIVSRDGAGNFIINHGAVSITGGMPTVANTNLIQIFGGPGSDQIFLDESHGALPGAELFGEAGDDTLTGGSGADVLYGGPGSDSLFGLGGADRLLGGDDPDTVTGGDGEDNAQLGAGDDRFIWNSGDDTDLIEGGSEVDTVEVNGGNEPEMFTATANGTRVRFDRIEPGPFFLDLGACEKLLLRANGGNDRFSATGNLAALIQITVDGGAGEDNLLGSNGVDVLAGGEGNDFVDGQQGSDMIFLGAGNDIFQWDPGDGSDTIEGEGDLDTLLFNGSNGAEIFDASNNGGRVRFTRNIGNIVMDLDGIESLTVNALGSADTLTVNDLTGTHLANVNVELAGTLGGATGDGTADTVIINGSNADDIVTATLPAGDLLVSGLAAGVLVDGFEPTMDTVRIQALGGDDIVDASAVGPGAPLLIFGGGSGNDILFGTAGADTLLGGDNDDLLFGNGGTDLLDGGTGDNILLPNGPNATSGIVTIFGDEMGNALTISRDAAGALFSNGIPIPDATVANTFLIRVFGQGGNDTITFDETGGALPPAMLFGGAGLDTLAGSSGADFLFGGPQDDTLLGRGGIDQLFGGSGVDTLTGGDGEDRVFGEADPDRMIWNPGDDTDVNEGGAGSDIVEVNGGSGGEQFTITANGARVRFDRINPEPFALDIGTTESLVLNAHGGNDSFAATGNLAALIQITVDGGSGNDTLLGSNGLDHLSGGEDGDFIDGQQGNDLVFGGAGNDTIQWDPGDGSDTIEGQSDLDTLLFNGSNGAEIFDASNNGGRVRFTRNLGNIVMDLDDIERLTVNALGAVDTLTINDLAGTDLANITAQLASTLGGSAGDTVADTVIINGTGPGDTITATHPGGGLLVSGLAANITVVGFDTTLDIVRLQGLGGADVLDASAVGAGALLLVLDGGLGEDSLFGSAGHDQLFGGESDDTILGHGGIDSLFGGGGNDTLTGGDGSDQVFGEADSDRMIWNPGDDTDLNEGGDGSDIVEVNGSNGDEQFTTTANGVRVRFDRINPEPFALDIGTTESLVLNAHGGNDSFAATGNLAALIQITVDGGTGADTLFGSNGIDHLIGGDDGDFIDGQQGTDVIFGGTGNDTIQWDPGDGSETIEGQADTDTLVFNGSNGAEILEASANGGRVRFTRNLGNIVMDLDDIERLMLNALGNADSLTINDLTGTDLVDLSIDLAGTLGGGAGDGQVDSITLNGTPASDAISITAPPGALLVSGLPATVRITHSEVANDDLIVNGLGGSDTFSIAPAATSLIEVFTNQ